MEHSLNLKNWKKACHQIINSENCPRNRFYMKIKRKWEKTKIIRICEFLKILF